MKVRDDESGRWIDVDPVAAAKGMLRHARDFSDGSPQHNLLRDEWEQRALDLIRDAAAACERCGVYDGQPHPEWCDIRPPKGRHARSRR